MKKQNIIKLIVSICFDVLDFFIGRIPILGTFFDIAGTILGYSLWGKAGLLQGLEIIDITDQLDSFIPTLTIIGLYKIFKGD